MTLLLENLLKSELVLGGTKKSGLLLSDLAAGVQNSENLFQQKGICQHYYHSKRERKWRNTSKGELERKRGMTHLDHIGLSGGKCARSEVGKCWFGSSCHKVGRQEGSGSSGAEGRMERCAKHRSYR